jgi:hypothetical protein
LITEQFTKGMSQAEKDEWVKSVTEKVGSAESWLDTDWDNEKNKVNTKLSEIKTGLDNLPTAIQNAADSKAITSEATDLVAKGFDIGDAGVEYNKETGMYQVKAGTDIKTA